MMASYFFGFSESACGRGNFESARHADDFHVLLFAPHCTSPSNALCKSRSVIKALNLDTTIANRFPVALSLPSIALSRRLDGAFKFDSSSNPLSSRAKPRTCASCCRCRNAWVVRCAQNDNLKKKIRVKSA